MMPNLFLLAVLRWSTDWWLLILSLSYLLAIASVPSVLLQRRGKPHSAVSWLLVLFALPGIGIFLWWAIGRKHLERQRRKRRRAAAKTAFALTQVRDESTAAASPLDLLPIRFMPVEEAEWVFPPTIDNRVRLLIDAAEAYPAIEAAIRAAKQHIHISFYIWNDDATGRAWRDMLIEKAKAGVHVRLLLDGLGSRFARRRKMMRPLQEAGGEVAFFLPLTLWSTRPTINFRNHRKIVLADGCTGFLGGINIGDEYTSGWHDLALQLEGSVVDQLQETFAEDWFFATGREIVAPQIFCQWQTPEGQAALPPPDDAHAVCSLLASGPHTPHNFTHDALFLSLAQAKQRVYITTPYLIPEESTMAALRTAVYRGVDVRVLVPAKSDAWIVQWAGRSYYPDLLAAGVRLYEYLPTILHAKSVVIDDDLSIVGSANIDVRSFRLNFEASCLARSKPLAHRLLDLFSRNLQHSREITHEDVQRRSYLSQLGDAAAHLLSPLM
ncbi:MAG TPA: cardiolipin synthase [Pirellulales bacterium]|jgi:cardiolipin synthase|nr:cardiolipin synthase [Pirellulales bacterium]